MEAQETITEPVKPQAVVAGIPRATEWRGAAFSEITTQTATAVHSVSLAPQEEVAEFRGEIRHRYETSSMTGWDHGGLNE